LFAAAALAASAGLAACQKSTPQVAALPLDTGAAQPLGEAPPPGGLPPAPPARIATLADYHDAYAYPDQAWGMSWAFGDSPPDYAFYDDGVTPWVWVADDDSECLAEPVPGGERYYYFEPGAYTPFYVQDPSYGYGFENGQLVAIYARGVREIAPGADPTGAATAGQYLARGRLLRQAASSQPHRAVEAANWSARRGLISAEHTAFAKDAARDPAWRAYHNRHEAQDQQRFAAEATRRETWAAQTDTRLGEAARAEREQRLAQTIVRGGAPGRSPPAAPAQALNRYAAAAPKPPAQFASQASPRRQALAERAPRQGFSAARAPVERPQAMARAATEHANDTAYRARPAAPFAEHRAPAEVAQPRAFRPPAAPAPAARVAPAPHAPPPAAVQAAPQVHVAPPGANADNKRH
jgi:hypothetical protein